MKYSINLLFLFAVLLIVGCGDGRPERVPVSGKVTIDGQPLTTGSVMFISETSRPAVGEIQQDGTFSLFTYEANDGCIPGSYRVSISANESTETSQKNLIPKKYFDHKTSGLSQEIVGPKSDIVFALEWGGEKPHKETFEKE